MVEEITDEAVELVARVAALDIGKASLTACVRASHEDKKGRRRQEVRTFAATTRSLLELQDGAHPREAARGEAAGGRPVNRTIGRFIVTVHLTLTRASFSGMQPGSVKQAYQTFAGYRGIEEWLGDARLPGIQNRYGRTGSGRDNALSCHRWSTVSRLAISRRADA